MLAPNPDKPQTWTDDRIELLKQLWAEGKTATECGKELGVSRSGIIGKVHRLGLARRGWRNPHPDHMETIQKMWIGGFTVAQISEQLGITKQTVYKKLAQIKTEPSRDYRPREKKIKIGGNGQIFKFVPAPPGKELSADEIPLAQRKTLMELTDNCCRWPYGEVGTEGFFFCGAPTDISGASYCGRHSYSAYRHDSYVPWGFR